ncbi:MAG: M20 family metallopeptidase [Anaerolineales bacterium]
MTEPIVAFLEEKLDDYLDDLRSLVGIDSGSYDKAGVDAANDWLEDRLTRMRLAVRRHPHAEFGDDLVATLIGKGQTRILLLGHSDTVFPTGTAVERPMTIHGDKVLGPGTCDMKAGLLTGIYALEVLREIGFEDYKSISYLCVSDEEVGGESHSKPLIRSEARKADVALTLEAARENGDIVTARKGLCWYIVEAFGRSAHSGVEPEKGRNAIVALAHQIIALQTLNGLKPGMTVNTGYIEGGLAPNIVPDYAKIRVDLRAFSKDDMEEFEDAFREQLANAELPGVNVAFKAEEGSFCPPMERTHAVVKLEELAQKAARELGFEVKGASTGGVSDANIAADEGTPVLDGLGPIGGLDHSPEEYIELNSIVPRTSLLAKLIMAISQREKA